MNIAEKYSIRTFSIGKMLTRRPKIYSNSAQNFHIFNKLHNMNDKFTKSNKIS